MGLDRGVRQRRLWDIEGMRANSAREVQLLRDAGALAALPSSPLAIWR